MTQHALELLQKVLALTEEERAEPAGSLIESLDGRADADAESAWNQEIARRVAKMDAGRAKTVSWEEVQERITSRIKNGKHQN
jgi:putative addiction module component (TIGR02574 family)